MKYQLWDGSIVVRGIEAEHIRFEGGVFFVHKKAGAIWDWEQAFTLKPGQILAAVKDGEETA